MASANTLTDLIPNMYLAMDRVSREMVGMTSAVTFAAGAEGVAKGQLVRFPIVPALSAVDVVPSMTLPDPDGIDIGNDYMTISKVRSVRFPWNGEEQLGLKDVYNTVLTDQFAQAMRTIVNELESDLCGLYVGASRACGTAGTIPFATTLEGVSSSLKLLKDNGVGEGSDLQLVINTAAGAALRNLGIVSKANESGSDETLRRGTLLDIYGFNIRESAQIKAHTKGTGTNFQTAASAAVGATTITLDTGSGTVLAGDVVTFAGDTNKYVVKTALSAGTLVIQEPGLLQALGNDVAMTVGDSYRANLAFPRSAIQVLVRPPAKPARDAAIDSMIITDPVSKISFRVSIYPGYGMVVYEVALAWGEKLTKGESLGTLMG